MKLKKCLIAFLIGFSLLFSGALISCGDTPATNEKEQNNELSENNSENETENKTDKDKESDANKDKDSDKDTSKDKDDAKEDSSSDTNAESTSSGTQYTVTFNTDGGSTVTSLTVTKDAKATRPATDPTKTGYDFAGWYSNDTFTTAFDFNTAITANTTVYAKWTIKTGYFEVTFNTNGGTAISSVSVESGKKVTQPTAPTKTACSFAGWYSNATLTTPFDFNTSITSPITLYAKWEDAGAVSGISITQAVSDTVTKNETGFGFTAPEGYSEYRWMIYGSNLKENDIPAITTTSNVWTADETFMNQYGPLATTYEISLDSPNPLGTRFISGEKYILIVSGVNDSVIDLFKIIFEM